MTVDTFVEFCVFLPPYILIFVVLQVENVAEGEARRYFDHAVVLKNSIMFLRNNKELLSDEENGNALGLGEFLCLSTKNLLLIRDIYWRNFTPLHFAE